MESPDSFPLIRGCACVGKFHFVLSHATKRYFAAYLMLLCCIQYIVSIIWDMHLGINRLCVLECVLCMHVFFRTFSCISTQFCLLGIWRYAIMIYFLPLFVLAGSHNFSLTCVHLRFICQRQMVTSIRSTWHLVGDKHLVLTQPVFICYLWLLQMKWQHRVEHFENVHWSFVFLLNVSDLAI